MQHACKKEKHASESFTWNTDLAEVAWENVNELPEDIMQWRAFGVTVMNPEYQLLRNAYNETDMEYSDGN